MASKLAPGKMRHYVYDNEKNKLVLVAEHESVPVNKADLPPPSPHVLKHLKELAPQPKRPRKRKSA